jgi:hypothetical protein
MGGEEKIRGLTALHVQAVAIRNMLEQSERPEGPYIVENDQAEEWRDLAHNNWKKTAKLQVAMQPEFVMTELVSAGRACTDHPPAACLLLHAVSDPAGTQRRERAGSGVHPWTETQS